MMNNRRLRTSTRIIQWPVFKARDAVRYVDFDVYTRWHMLKTLLNSGVSFDEFARRLGWKRSKVDKMILREKIDIQMTEVSMWYHVLGYKINWNQT